VSYLNSPRKGCPRGMKSCVWTHLNLMKWKTTSEITKNGRLPHNKIKMEGNLKKKMEDNVKKNLKNGRRPRKNNGKQTNKKNLKLN
jgi:hypothetical protein